MLSTTAENEAMLSYEAFRKEVLNDYTKCMISREASLMGRREVLTGKAKFGVFSDGKEVAQTAMAEIFQPGDFRAGYYRDQRLCYLLVWQHLNSFCTVVCRP